MRVRIDVLALSLPLAAKTDAKHSTDLSKVRHDFDEQGEGGFCIRNFSCHSGPVVVKLSRSR